MIRKICWLTFLVVLNGCATQSSFKSMDMPANEWQQLKSQLSYNIEQYKTHSTNKGFYLERIKEGLTKSSKQIGVPSSDEVLSEAKSIVSEAQGIVDADVAANKFCKNEYQKFNEEVTATIAEYSDKVRVSNRTGLDLQPKIQASIGEIELTRNDCPFDISKIKNAKINLNLYRIRNVLDRENIEYNFEINMNGNIERFKEQKKISLDYSVLKSSLPLFDISLNSINCDIVQLPVYDNNDKYLYVHSSGSNLRIENKSNKFITVSEVWFYYNKHISKVWYNDISMPPESVKDNLTFKITDAQKRDMSFKDITKKELLTTKIPIGYAVKYKIDNSNIENTLYYVNSYTLADLIKLN